MKKFKNITDFFETKSPADVEQFVEKNLEISQQVYSIMKEKGWSQIDLAKALGKTTAEVSKWLSGTHNLTLRSIAKMEAALEQDIILTPRKAEEQYQKVKYLSVDVPATKNQVDTTNINFVVIKEYSKSTSSKNKIA